MKQYGEWHLLRDIKKWIPRNGQGFLGIGDDADILTGLTSRSVVACCDAVVDGIDFRSRIDRPEQIGRKALAINLSDLAAMGAKPMAWLLTLGLPKSPAPSWLRRVYAGLTRLARQYSMVCLGGDLTRSKELFLSLTALGVPFRDRVLTRSGAKAGDALFVTGQLGGSLAGHHFSFEPRVHESAFLIKHFHPSSMIDISDGAVQDLGHLLRASGVGARIDLEAIPVSKAARRMAGKSHPDQALRAALTDGEDFELLFTLSEKEAAGVGPAWKRRFPTTALTLIGRVIPGTRIEFWSHGIRTRWNARQWPGYTHLGHP